MDGECKNSIELGFEPYVPGPYVPVAVDELLKPVKTVGKGTGFVTAARSDLVGLTVVYKNDRYAVGLKVWVESTTLRQTWASGEYRFSVPGGPQFALLPENLVRLVTRG